MTTYTVHTYVTMRIPVNVDAKNPRAAAIAGRDAALNAVRDFIVTQRLPSGSEFAEEYEDTMVVDKLNKAGNVARTWELDPLDRSER